jgi:transcription initiation factor TFIIA large subunit
VDNSSMYNIPTGSSDYPTPVSDAGGSTDGKAGRPSPFMVSTDLIFQPSLFSRC